MSLPEKLNTAPQQNSSSTQSHSAEAMSLAETHAASISEKNLMKSSHATPVKHATRTICWSLPNIYFHGIKMRLLRIITKLPCTTIFLLHKILTPAQRHTLSPRFLASTRCTAHRTTPCGAAPALV